MRLLLIPIVLIFTLNVQQLSAAELPSYFPECQKAAARKLHTLAGLEDAYLIKIELINQDLTWWKPSKYFLFEGIARKADGTEISLRTITQKPIIPRGECF